MSATPARPPALERLPSGRHRLTRADVVASQRGRLIDAVVETVAVNGYPSTTVADIVERAGVSRRTFYEQFAGREDCFLAAYDLGVEFALAQLRDASGALPRDADWRDRTRTEVETYLRVLAAEPAFAWALHVEVLRAGPAALERRAEVFRLFARRTRRLHELARRQRPELPKLPPEAFQLHVGGMDELVRDCLRTRGAAALPARAEGAIRGTVALLGGE